MGVLAQAERAVLFVVCGDDNVQEGMRIALYDKSPQMVASKRFAVSYHFRNYGRTAAVRADFSANMIMAAALPEVPRYVPVMNVLREQAMSPNGETGTFECGSEEIYSYNTTAAAAVIDGTGQSIWFFGRATYTDIFGNAHQHRFLYRWEGERRRFVSAYDERYCEDT